MKTIALAATPILLLSMLHAAFGIWCFHCSSYEHPECATLLANETSSPYYIECNDPNYNYTFCRKTVITIIDSDKYIRVTRSCGYVQYKEAEDNCYETDDAFKFERSCQCFSDGCNASSTARLSWLALGGALATLLLKLQLNH